MFTHSPKFISVVIPQNAVYFFQLSIQEFRQKTRYFSSPSGRHFTSQILSNSFTRKTAQAMGKFFIVITCICSYAIKTWGILVLIISVIVNWAITFLIIAEISSWHLKIYFQFWSQNILLLATNSVISAARRM